ncbi:MAG: phage protease, partial [Burkholderiaceae bacterium]|nr:phage protease [Burkholderiaceae bacterium]
MAEGDTSSWVTVTRTGSFTDPRYGKFDITPAMLAQMVSNFEARVLGQDVFIDVAHKPSDGAAGKVLKLAVEGNKLRALVEWTAFGIEAVRQRGFAYLSAEYHEQWRDNEKGNPHGCVLLAAGLTTRPVIKNLDTVTLSEGSGDDEAKLAIHPQLIKALESGTMNYLEQLKSKLLSQGLTLEQIAPILAEAAKQLSAANSDEA